MSHCEDWGGAGRHRAVFLTREDADPATSKEPAPPADDPDPPGLILPDGGINWNCPCLGGMAVGPCGIEFREAFQCFHYRWVGDGGLLFFFFFFFCLTAQPVLASLVARSRWRQEL